MLQNSRVCSLGCSVRGRARLRSRRRISYGTSTPSGSPSVPQPPFDSAFRRCARCRNMRKPRGDLDRRLGSVLASAFQDQETRRHERRERQSRALHRHTADAVLRFVASWMPLSCRGPGHAMPLCRYVVICGFWSCRTPCTAERSSWTPSRRSHSPHSIPQHPQLCCCAFAHACSSGAA